MVVKIMVPFSVPNIVRHLIIEYLGYSRRDPYFDKHPGILAMGFGLVQLYRYNPKP